MPFEFSINKKKRILCVGTDGVLTSQDMDTYYNRLREMGGIGDCSKGLIDLTHPNLSMKAVSLTSVRNMGWQFKALPLMQRGSRMAFVTHSKLVYGFVRVFMARRGDDIEIKPFTIMDEALHWLEISDADLVR